MTPTTFLSQPGNKSYNVSTARFLTGGYSGKILAFRFQAIKVIILKI